MKSLCLLAIGVMIFGFSSTVHSQTMREKLKAQKDKLSKTMSGNKCAPDLTEEDVVELLGGLKPDDGILTPFHQANIGNVVFTKTHMEPKDVTAADVVTEFSVNDPIYFTFFMDKSFGNQVLYPLNQDGTGGFNDGWCWDKSFKKFRPEENGTGVPQLNMYGTNMVYVEVDGVQIEDVPFYAAVNVNSTKTAVSGYIVPDPKDDMLAADKLIDYLIAMPEGTHAVNVEIAGFDLSIGMTKGLVASGGFTLTKKAGETFSPVMGRSWAGYKAKMNDANLEAKVLAAVKEFGKVNGYDEQFVKIKIESPNWVITRTKTLAPVITGRYIVAFCYSTWPNGLCKVQRYSFRQEYDGTNYQSNVISRGVFGNDYPTAIDCD